MTVNIGIGENVRVVSGPHEGRSGQVVHVKDQSVGMGEPEPFAIIEYPDENAPGGKDQVAVPVRRLARRG